MKNISQKPRVGSQIGRATELSAPCMEKDTSTYLRILETNKKKKCKRERETSHTKKGQESVVLRFTIARMDVGR